MIVTCSWQTRNEINITVANCYHNVRLYLGQPRKNSFLALVKHSNYTGHLLAFVVVFFKRDSLTAETKLRLSKSSSALTTMLRNGGAGARPVSVDSLAPFAVIIGNADASERKKHTVNNLL